MEPQSVLRRVLQKEFFCSTHFFVPFFFCPLCSLVKKSLSKIPGEMMKTVELFSAVQPNGRRTVSVQNLTLLSLHFRKIWNGTDIWRCCHARRRPSLCPRVRQPPFVRLVLSFPAFTFPCSFLRYIRTEPYTKKQGFHGFAPPLFDEIRYIMISADKFYNFFSHKLCTNVNISCII